MKFRFTKRDLKTTLKNHYKRKDTTYAVIDTALYIILMLISIYALEFMTNIDKFTIYLLSAVIAAISNLYIGYLIEKED